MLALNSIVTPGSIPRSKEVCVYTLCLVLLSLFWYSTASALLWSGILDPSRATDWTQAGVTGGIPNRTIVCATISPYTGTAATINNAIASCPSGQVVQLQAGTFNLSSGIRISNSGVTLRGAGANATSLVFAAGSADGCDGHQALICVFGFSGAEDGLTTKVNWTGGFAQSTTTITVDSSAGMVVGQHLVLSQANDASDTGGIVMGDGAGFSVEGTCGANNAANTGYCETQV